MIHVFILNLRYVTMFSVFCTLFLFPSNFLVSKKVVSNNISCFVPGGRPLSRRMVFLVTDGQSNVKQHLTIPNAEALKKSNVDIFVVAVGNYISGIQEMVRVASHPPQNFLFRVESVAGFLEIVNLVIKKVDRNLYKVVGKLPPPC